MTDQVPNQPHSVGFTGADIPPPEGSPVAVPELAADQVGDLGGIAASGSVETHQPTEVKPTVKIDVADYDPNGEKLEVQASREQEWEHNKDRAWAMAEASNGPRSAAANYRRAADSFRGGAERAQAEAVNLRKEAEDLDGRDRSHKLVEAYSLDDVVSTKQLWAKQESEKAQRADKVANHEENKAAKVYDAKQTIDENLTALNSEEDLAARNVYNRFKLSAEIGASEESTYERIRADENTLQAAIDSAYEALRVVKNNNLHSYEIIESTRRATETLTDELSVTLDKLRAKAREASDEILRSREFIDKTKAEANKQYQARQGEYHDTALKEMTDAGIAFNSGDQNQTPPVAPDAAQAA